MGIWLEDGLRTCDSNCIARSLETQNLGPHCKATAFHLHFNEADSLSLGNNGLGRLTLKVYLHSRLYYYCYYFKLEWRFSTA